MIKPIDEPLDEALADAAGGTGDAGETPAPPGNRDVTAEAAAFFGPDTPLRRAPEYGGRAYEERPQQLEMAVAVAEALRDGAHLCVEAPTGVGKTFAYLVPAILFARGGGRPAVVSTHTISLQEQIVGKDLPLLGRLMGVEFRYALAKGRANYLCLRRLEAAAGDQKEYLPSAELLPELEKLRLWAGRTTDGSKGDLDPEPDPQVWESVCCEVGNCLAGACPFFRHCFLHRARRRLDDAHIIVANHALFFADLGMRLRADGDADAGLLPDYGMVVLDEGHCIEDTAAEHLGLRLTVHGLRRILRRLYNPERNRGLLVDVRYTEPRLAVIAAAERVERFFRRIRDWLEQQEGNPVRYATPGHVPDLLSEALEGVGRGVSKVAKEEKAEDESRATELSGLAWQLAEYRAGVHAFLDMTLDGHVYWFERFGPRLQSLSLNAVPIHVGNLLAQHLFAQDFTVVVTSATLAVRGRMDFFQQRVGAVGTRTRVLSSPFDFERQVVLHVPAGMPSPKDGDRFLEAACVQIRRFVGMTHGKAFVLFTSFQMLQEAADELRGFFEEEGIRLLVQGEGLSRSRMLEAFRKDTDSVIFGAASFWTGVDVPGDSLSNVIIVKLPFAVPDHPLVAARHEAIECEGRNAFWEYSLPEAVLRFRQGCGRLIRSRDDRGIIVVLDNRVLTARYGRAFLDSLPECPLVTDG